MDNIVYSNNPNEGTVQAQIEGKYRKVTLTRAIDNTADILYQDNPNVGKVLFTGEDGKKHTATLVMDINGGGGGSVDYTKVVSKTKTMPVASADNANIIYMYDGATDATYTHGYVYENVKTATYTDTVTFEPATLSGTVVTATAGALAGLCAEYIQADITTITNGTLTYDDAGSLWRFVGKDAEDNIVGTFQIYTPDYEDAGFTFTGTPQDGDVVAFTCTIEEVSATYAWNRIDVQPVPTAQEIGAAVKTNKTATLTVADWSSNTQTVTVTGVTATNTVFVSPAPASAADYASAGIICTAQGTSSLSFTCTTTPTNAITVNVVIID